LSLLDRPAFLDALLPAADAIGVPITLDQADAMARYAERLLTFNEHTNLTRITDPCEIAVKHFVDSLTVLRALPELPLNATFADVGTGAGFPGVALKIVRPDLRLTLIDSLAKRLRFLDAVVADLGLNDVICVHSRAEDAGRDRRRRDCYDVVTARALAALPVLLEWCGPLARPTGCIVALKTAWIDGELAASGSVAAALRLQLETDLALTLPASGDSVDAPARRLLVYRKTAPTPAGFPRTAAEIKNKPFPAS
jgi:16S rRNA (guanine527-N7)-methyltransferase